VWDAARSTPGPRPATHVAHARGNQRHPLCPFRPRLLLPRCQRGVPRPAPDRPCPSFFALAVGTVPLPSHGLHSSTHDYDARIDSSTEDAQSNAELWTRIFLIKIYKYVKVGRANAIRSFSLMYVLGEFNGYICMSTSTSTKDAVDELYYLIDHLHKSKILYMHKHNLSMEHLRPCLVLRTKF
jgi:hypothetical protein